MIFLLQRQCLLFKKTISIKMGIPFLGIQTWLNGCSPCFPLRGNQVTVIQTPTKFYDEIIERCSTAQNRITIASLYIGTEKLEQKLVETISSRLEQMKNDELNVLVLLDYARSSRNKISSRTMLLPLISKYNSSCQVALYHSPMLRGFLKKNLPQRYNELIGVQHMKVYLFDDSVILSGANLSNDYFTNRQDRYILIENCKEFCDFLNGLVKKVMDFSLHLTADNKDIMSLEIENLEHPYLGDKNKFITQVRNHVWDYYQKSIENNKERNNVENNDTWIYPLIEMGQLNISHDSKIITKLIETAPIQSCLNVSTGYFNLTKQYIDSIVHKSKANFNIFMAHPNANGFLGSKGPSGGIPAAYTLLAQRFLSLVSTTNQSNRINLFEYQKPGWTYHAKGLWYYLPGQKLPSLTLIGSPNFNDRSVNRDLELNLALVTENATLQQNLLDEEKNLRHNMSPFPKILSTDRIPPFWVKCVVAFFKNFF